MLNLLGIFIGGGLGSILRYLLSLRIGSHWGIMTVNLIGAVCIGIAFEYFLSRDNLRPEVRAFVITGLLGGFTTFSTYMLDFGNLINSNKIGEAFAYLLGSLFLGIVFLYLGMLIGKSVLS